MLALLLRAYYAMSGTELAYAATLCYAISGLKTNFDTIWVKESNFLASSMNAITLAGTPFLGTNFHFAGTNFRKAGTNFHYAGTTGNAHSTAPTNRRRAYDLWCYPPPMTLRNRYALSGTELRYAATRPA
eukprot:2680395-Rhodomonas_salina.2